MSNLTLHKAKDIQYIPVNTRQPTTVEDILDELENIIKKEVTINNTWSQVYTILKREGRM